MTHLDDVDEQKRRLTHGKLFQYEKDGLSAAQFRDEGDHSLYTEENLTVRRSLRTISTAGGSC